MGNNLYYLEENENIKHKIKCGKKNRRDGRETQQNVGRDIPYSHCFVLPMFSKPRKMSEKVK